VSFWFSRAGDIPAGGYREITRAQIGDSESLVTGNEAFRSPQGSWPRGGGFGRLRRAWRADAGDRQALSAGHLATVSGASDAQATLPEPGEGGRRGGR